MQETQREISVKIWNSPVGVPCGTHIFHLRFSVHITLLKKLFELTIDSVPESFRWPVKTII